MEYLEYCDALAVEIERFSALLEGADPAAMVPSCPEWSVLDLAGHLGMVHQWADHLVRVRAAERIPRTDMELRAGPVDAQWLRRGGASLVTTLKSADPDDAMWAWGSNQHVRFWSRRQLHETFVHRIDLELTLGTVPEAEPVIASDAIDEFLCNLTDAGRLSPGVSEIRGEGEVLRFSARDTRASWVIQLLADGFRLGDVDEAPNVELSGLAGDLLLVLYRRQTIDESPVVVEGDQALVNFWLAHSALQ